MKSGTNERSIYLCRMKSLKYQCTRVCTPAGLKYVISFFGAREQTTTGTVATRGTHYFVTLTRLRTNGRTAREYVIVHVHLQQQYYCNLYLFLLEKCSFCAKIFIYFLFRLFHFQEEKQIAPRMKCYHC